tara:strand:+ start:2852 stop:3088 length:237 start_codon:yes stop_codon:yes gene_type:complete
MQKIINVLAIASTIVSATVVGGGVYVYLNRSSIIDGVKSKVMESLMPSVPVPSGLGSGTTPEVGLPELPVSDVEVPSF